MSFFLQQSTKGETTVSRVLLTGVSIVLAYVVGGGLLAVGLVAVLGNGTASGSGVGADALGLSQVEFLLVGLLPFAVVAAALWGCMREVHRRPFRTLIRGTSSVDVRKMGFAAATWTGLFLMAAGVAVTLDPEGYRVVVEPMALLGLVAVAGVLIPIQAATEELVIRGYGMQTLARWTPTGWTPLVVTSGVFGLLHGTNPEVAAFGAAVMMPYYVGFGLAMGLWTLVDDGLELAIGVHVANNLLGTVLFTYPESALHTPALIRIQDLNPTTDLLGWIATALAFTAICAVRYGWTWADLRRGVGGREKGNA